MNKKKYQYLTAPVYGFDYDKIIENAYSYGNKQNQANYLRWIKRQFSIRFAGDEAKKDQLYLELMAEGFLKKIDSTIDEYENWKNPKVETKRKTGYTIEYIKDDPPDKKYFTSEVHYQLRCCESTVRFWYATGYSIDAEMAKEWERLGHKIGSSKNSKRMKLTISKIGSRNVVEQKDLMEFLKFKSKFI